MIYSLMPILHQCSLPEHLQNKRGQNV